MGNLPVSGAKSGDFARNAILQAAGTVAAFAFFKPTEHDNGTINGQAYSAGSTGAPILDGAHASVECKVAQIVEHGDHHILVGEVIHASVAREPAGRPDEAILEMKDLGEKVFYGG